MLDPKDHLIDLVERTDHLSLKDEQQKDETIKRVVSWKTRERVEDLTYATFQLKKYGKQFNRLVLQNGVLFRKFFDDTGKIKTLQFCLPKHLWREVVYGLHNSKLAGHVGIAKTVQEFRKRFYFPGFTEYLITMIKNCFTCIQTKAISNRALRTFLQPV